MTEPHRDILDSAMRIGGLTTRDELALLARLAAAAPTRGFAVELGTFRGRATSVLCGVLGWPRVASMDHWKMQHHGHNDLARTEQTLARLGYFPKLLTGRTDRPPPWLKPVALLFVDSDHTPRCVRAELDCWLPRVLQGGVVAFHDYGVAKYPGYSEAVRRAMKGWEPAAQIGTLAAWKNPSQ